MQRPFDPSDRQLLRRVLTFWQATEETFVMRAKGDYVDYRFFPEPDLQPLLVEPALLEASRQALPELPEYKFRYCTGGGRVMPGRPGLPSRAPSTTDASCH